MLKDFHGRHIHKLRLSLLDACNFRCLYCMPQNPRFMPAKLLLNRSDIVTITRVLVSLGIDEIRVTGGEPSLRPDFLEIMQDLSQFKLKKLAMTSNGLHLHRLLPALKKTRCQHINFSLDGLNRDTFKTMAKSDSLEAVLTSIFMAQELGFRVKINMVVMRGVNDAEIENFIEFSAQHDIEVRFLELMRIGVARQNFEKHFISAGEIISRLEQHWPLTALDSAPDSTAFNYRLSNGARIGFIASESRPFCRGCSRLRLAADGVLHPCLMVDSGVSLKNQSREAIEQLLLKVMDRKPTERIFEVDRPMNQIGG